MKTGLRKGFSTTELVFALAVVGVLAAIAVPAITKHITDSRVKQAESELALLKASIHRLAWDTGKWPGGISRDTTGGSETWDLSTADAGLLSRDADFDSSEWQGPYIDEIKADPWGNPYFFDPAYKISGVDQVVVGSLGPDGVGRGSHDSDNIYVIIK